MKDKIISGMIVADNVRILYCFPKKRLNFYMLNFYRGEIP